MPRQKEKPRWVKYIDHCMSELVDEASGERGDWADVVKEAFGYYNCDREIIFGNALSSAARRKPDAPSQVHVPLLRQHVDSFCASTTHNDIKIRYVPKLDQQGVEDLARMGNALFEAYRSHICWDTKIHTLALHTALFGRGYVQLYIDEVQDFPEPRADLRLLNAWQVYSTPGVPFEQATEVVTECWIDRDELKAQYPEFADEIDGIETVGEAKEREEETGVRAGRWGTIARDSKVPGYGTQSAVVSKNAVLVRERWKFDPSYETYPRAESEREMEQEHAMIRAAIEAVDMSLLPQTPDLLIKDEQYHDDHSVGHMLLVKEIREEMNEREAVEINEYGVVTEDYKWGTAKRAVAEAAIALLLAHEELHSTLSEEMEEWQVGKYEKYAGGWRHSIIIGQGPEAVGIYDGYSKFYDYGIQGIPIIEFNVQPSPLNLWIGSYASLLVDENRLLNSFINSANDNYALFGSNQWWHEAGLDRRPGFHISTDPKEPTTLPPDAKFGSPMAKAGIIPAVGIPSDAFNMIQLVLALAQQTSGVFGSLRGQRQEGVRSGQHEQFLAQANRAQLDAYHRLWKNSLENLCIKLFKLMLAVPPDDRYVKPLIDGKAVDVDFDTLEQVDFTIEVIMAPGGTSATEERLQITQAIAQNMTQHPLIQADPMGLVTLLKFMAESWKLQAPDMSEAMMKYADQLRERAEQMAMQPQAPPGGQPQGGQRG